MTMKTMKTSTTFTNKEPVKVLMVSAGGYGYYYLQTLFEKRFEGMAQVVAVVEPDEAQVKRHPQIAEQKIPVFKTVDEFFTHHNADLTVVSSPIQYHVPQSITALENGSHVLCEKPVAATLQEVDCLIAAKNRYGKQVRIGFQWSYTHTIRSLKQDILSGQFGKPHKFKTLCLWPRGDDYYGRNTWAGKRKDPLGNWVLDSPANNAMAHFLFNLLYLSGETMDTCDEPDTMTCEVYRCNKIETFDTVVCKIITTGQFEILFYASHVTEKTVHPVFELEFERATIRFENPEKGIEVTFTDGTTKSYTSPDKENQFLKLEEALEAVRSPVPVLCGPETARAHTVAILGIHAAFPKAATIPDELIQRDPVEKRLYVQDLDDQLKTCYHSGLLLSEAKVPWAKTGHWEKSMV